MGIVKKMISAALAIAVAASQPVVSATAANKRGAKLPASYNNIFLPESKVVSDEKPFQVFDIYNAYYGITTTKPPVTTTKPTTTKPVTTTKKPVTTTVTTTKKPVATTKKPVTTIVTTTKKPVTTTVTSTVRTSTSKIVSTTKPSVSSTSTVITAVATDAPVTTSAVTTDPFRFPEGTFLRGIDVSEFQSDIDWYKVKNSGKVDFAIIRAGYGKEYDQKDYRFDQNARSAQAAGMDFGIYWYSYAMDVESARLEAEVCMSMLDGYSFTYPVFFDIEERSQRDGLTPYQFSQIVDTFCSTLEENGYTAGIYSFGSMLETKLYDNIIEKYAIWVAEYDSAVKVYKGDYDIWQYSSSGLVDGISTIVDLNYCYVDLSKKIGVNPSHGSLPVISPDAETNPALSSPAVIAGTAGVKLSAENGSVDWVKLKNSGIKFAMIKAAESGTDPETPVLDSAFIENLEAAQKNGLGVGLYWHSKAMTVDDMEKEAETFIELLSEIKPNYPVYLDMTDAVYQSSTVTSEEMTLLADTFCTKLEEEKFYVGIYGTDKVLNKLNSKLFDKFDVWLTVGVAAAPNFSQSAGITGINGINVPGINGGVEFLSTGRNYPSVMENYHLNGF